MVRDTIVGLLRLKRHDQYRDIMGKRFEKGHLTAMGDDQIRLLQQCLERCERNDTNPFVARFDRRDILLPAGSDENIVMCFKQALEKLFGHGAIAAADAKTHYCHWAGPIGIALRRKVCVRQAFPYERSDMKSVFFAGAA